MGGDTEISLNRAEPDAVVSKNKHFLNFNSFMQMEGSASPMPMPIKPPKTRGHLCGGAPGEGQHIETTVLRSLINRS